MERVLLDEVISTDYGQFDLIWVDGAGFDGDFGRFFRRQDNELVGAADPGGVFLNLARRSGGSRYRSSSSNRAGPARSIVGGRCRGVRHRPRGQQRALVLMGR
jgi:hypothetical protein